VTRRLALGLGRGRNVAEQKNKKQRSRALEHLLRFDCRQNITQQRSRLHVIPQVEIDYHTKRRTLERGEKGIHLRPGIPTFLRLELWVVVVCSSAKDQGVGKNTKGKIIREEKVRTEPKPLGSKEKSHNTGKKKKERKEGNLDQCVFFFHNFRKGAEGKGKKQDFWKNFGRRSFEPRTPKSGPSSKQEKVLH